jgi:hypothetical protein
VPHSDPFITARDRAYVLAATGDYMLWPNIAAVLASEGYSAAAIKRIGKDSAAQNELTALIHAAISKRPYAPAETWREREPETKVKLG